MKRLDLCDFLMLEQKLKAHLTHHSLTSHQLIEKFFKRKISEQVSYLFKNMKCLIFQITRVRIFFSRFILLQPSRREITKGKNMERSPSSHPTGGPTRGCTSRCSMQSASCQWTPMVHHNNHSCALASLKYSNTLLLICKLALAQGVCTGGKPVNGNSGSNVQI